MAKVEKAQAWLDDQVVKLSWDGRSKLTDEQTAALLEGGDAWAEVACTLECLNAEYIWARKESLRAEAAEKFGTDAAALHTDCVMVDLNLGQLVRQSRGYFALPLDIKHEQMPPGYEPGYEDYADELKALGVNPALVDETWPNIPERDSLIAPDDVWELWINNFYTGKWVVLLDASVVLDAAYRGTMDQYTVLKAGANVTIHSYWVGSSSVLAETQKDLEIDPSDIINDGARRYGVQACCGLVYSAWNGRLISN